METMWYLDSSAIQSMNFNKDWFTIYQSNRLACTIFMDDNGFKKAIGISFMNLQLKIEFNSNFFYKTKLILHDILYVCDLVEIFFE